MVTIAATKMTRMAVSFCSQLTGKISNQHIVYGSSTNGPNKCDDKNTEWIKLSFHS